MKHLASTHRPVLREIDGTFHDQARAAIDANRKLPNGGRPYTEADRARDLAKLEKQQQKWEARQRAAGPRAASIARFLNEKCLPSWAEMEECDISPSMIADALDQLGLRLVKKKKT